MPDRVISPGQPSPTTDGCPGFSFKSIQQPLTRRERDVLTWAAHGLTVKQAAEQYFLSERVIKQYRTTAFQKLNAANIVQAVAIAYARKLIKFDTNVA